VSKSAPYVISKRDQPRQWPWVGAYDNEYQQIVPSKQAFEMTAYRRMIRVSWK